MTKRQQYETDHRIGKFICFLINSILFLLYFHLTSEILKVIIFLFANATYFFGVNTISFLIETFLHHKHKHNKI